MSPDSKPSPWSSGKFEPVALSSESISVIDGGVDLAFDITAPSFDTDVYQLAYDVRSYRWNDYEQDCEDSSDETEDAGSTTTLLQFGSSGEPNIAIGRHSLKLGVARPLERSASTAAICIAWGVHVIRCWTLFRR